MPHFQGYDESKVRVRGQMAAIMALALMMGGAEAGAPGLPRLPEPKPKGYGVHLSKAERRGKSPAELQRLRAERMNDA